MGDIVNLRRARKDQARRLRDAEAKVNRAAFGRPKTEKKRTEAEAQRENARLEAHRLERSPDDGA
jgi:hypothetical protein